MQIQSSVSLAAVQENRHRSNRDVRHNQSENSNLPPRPIQISISQPVEEQIKTWSCIQKGIPKEV